MRAMPTKRGRRWAGLAVAGLVVFSGCAAGGDDQAGVVPDTGPGTTSTVPITEPPPVVTTAPEQILPEPVTVDGIPQVTVTPARAVVGSLVEFDGYGFVGRWMAGGPVWLSLGESCGLLAEVLADVRPDADGRLTGSFVVPEYGVCLGPPGGNILIAGNTYDLTYRCPTDCRIGSFTVVYPGDSTEEPTGTRCDGYVAFGPGEDGASGIYADGLSCDEARAFLAAHAEPTGAMNGAAHIEADGFVCDRTGQSDRFLPRSDYKCVRGDQVIFFVRT